MRILLPSLLLLLAAANAAAAVPERGAIDLRVHQLMEQTAAKGMAVAVIDGGKIVYVQAYGVRDRAGEALHTDTVMYGASLTKAVMAFVTLQLVDAGRISLDVPIAEDLERPLPSYGPDPEFPDKYGNYADLAGDDRWKRITPRLVLTHATGFANFGFMEPDGKLRIHFEPGTRYAYSGEGLILLQFAIEHGRAEKGLGFDVGDWADHHVFGPLGMTRTSLKWRPDFSGDVADGWNDSGTLELHHQRKKVRMAGSMDTTIADFSKFTAALVNGWGLSAASHAEMLRPQLHIGTKTQFPSFQPDLAPNRQREDLSAGLGVIVFRGPQGPGFYKGGHDGTTANTMVCLEARHAGVLILSNDVRAEAGYPELVRFILGDTGVPYDWEFGDRAGKS